MALSKKERSDHHSKYHASMQNARSALDQGALCHAIAAALEACEFAVGMIQFERKEHDVTHDTVESVEFVLNYAPIVFDCDSIQAIEQLLQNNRGLERNTESSLRDAVRSARDAMATNRLLWNRLAASESTGLADLKKEFAGQDKQTTVILDWWKYLGILCEFETTSGIAFHLATNMDRRTQAKCPGCGAVANAVKRAFLQAQKCPRCSSVVTFVLMPPASRSES